MGLITKSYPLRELPPRARRILKAGPARDSQNGTTSACAENTALNAANSAIIWNYLRVRGEYLPSESKA